MVGDPPIGGCPSSQFAGSEGRNPRTQRPEVLEDAYGVPRDEGDRPNKIKMKNAAVVPALILAVPLSDSDGPA